MKFSFHFYVCIAAFLIGINTGYGQMKKHLIDQYRQQSNHLIKTKRTYKINTLYNAIPRKPPNNLSPSYTYQSIPQSQIPTTQPLVLRAGDNQLPILIKGKVNTDNFIMPRESTATETKSYAYLDAIKDILQVEQPLKEFKISKINRDRKGYQHIRFQQRYKGLKVHGAEIILHEKGDEIRLMNGHPYPTPKLETLQPGLSEQQALDQTLRHLATQTSIKNYDPQLSAHPFSETELLIYHPERNPTDARLAWKVNITPNLSSHWTYFIDAHSGEMLSFYDEVCKFFHPIALGEKKEVSSPGNNNRSKNTTTAYFQGPETGNAPDLSDENRLLNIYENNGLYFLLDVSRAMFNASRSTLPGDPVGAIWTIDAQNTAPQNDNFEAIQIISNNPDAWDDRSGVSAHHNAAIAYEYYLNTFGRNSINGEGGNIISLVNVADEDSTDMDNAFWNGIAMFYGNGKQAFTSPLARSLDVAGHEMTHGVIQAEANLEYIGQSGALNESYADVFGVMIDRDDWQLGEDVVNRNIFRSGALRDMENPNNEGSRFGNIGWQPADLDEFVNLPETPEGDNGGVHVNSGIPNRAFFLIASTIGRDRAEKIYYHALQNYLVRSSQFIDMRIAALQSANDLYGQAEVDAVANAFDAVKIFAGEGTDTQTEIEENPGEEFILHTDADNSVLKIVTPAQSIVADPLSEIGPSNKPSITDDGSIIVYVGQDSSLQAIVINWSQGNFEQFPLDDRPIWRNVAISKDGQRLAALTTDLDNLVYIFDLTADEVEGIPLELYNPTTVEGVETGDVVFADVIEWDAQGEFLIYDAFNEIQTLDGGIQYWDIGFLRAWNNTQNTLGDGLITKLFTGLPENTSVGNPTFAKNAPFVVAFDFVAEDLFNGTTYSLETANIETGDVITLFNNSVLNYPNFSVDDGTIIFDAFTTQNNRVVAALDLADDRINLDGDGNPRALIGDINGARWGVWFANGQRVIVSNEAVLLDQESIQIYPNPFTDHISIAYEKAGQQQIQLFLYDLMGRILQQQNLRNPIETINLGNLPPGSYVLKLISSEGASHSQKIIKIE